VEERLRLPMFQDRVECGKNMVFQEVFEGLLRLKFFCQGPCLFLVREIDGRKLLFQPR
jgi:hypothetical protein